MMENEIWKDIKGYEGLYQVSNLGDIKSCKRFVNHYPKGIRVIEEKILKKIKGRYGYLHSHLSKECKVKMFQNHRLVAEAFIPTIDNKPYVNHIDGNKHNNNMLNLEWVDHYDNMRHTVRIGINSDRRGEKSFTSKLTNKDVIKIRDMYNNEKYKTKKIADLFKINIATVRGIVNKKSWKHLL